MSTNEDRPSVLLVAWEVSERGGGQERALAEYAAELERRGVSVEIASRTAPRSIGRHHRIGLDPHRPASEFLAAAGAIVRERREHCIVQAMVPVPGCHLYVPRGGLYPEAFARNAASRGRSVARVLGRGLLFSRRRRELLRAERALLRAPDRPRLVALSDGVRRHASRHYGIASREVALVRNGVAPLPAISADAVEDYRRSLDLPAGATIFLAAARNARLKGIPTLRAAARRLPRSAEWRIVVAGGVKARRQGRLIELGPVDSLAALYALADALVHPTWYDTSSRVVLEAVAAGLPVITTRFDGASEILDGGGVVLDEPGDVAGLASALESWLDPEVLRRVREYQAGRQEEVSMSRHVDAMLALMQRVRACAS